MSRVAAVTPEKAKNEVQKIYSDIQKNMGGKVPNIFQHMGNSPAVLKAFFSMADAANQTSLSPQLREQIALAVAQANECQYCLSAHSLLAGKAGIPTPQIMQARKGEAQDPKTNAILQTAKLIVNKRGKVTDQDVANLKKAGVSDTEIVEIILVIIQNMFTNYFNHIVDTKVDFPEAPKLQ